VEALEAAGVPCSPVNDIGELAASAQFAAMDMTQVLPGSGVRVVGLPISFDGQRPRSRRGAPAPGEHTDEVLGPR
jgi:formyl-CoA transferase